MPTHLLPDSPLSAIQRMLLGGSTPFSDPDWLFEVKYDGYRLLPEWDSDLVRLQ